MKQIAILGCGPAGLLAAHACRGTGAAVRVYAIKQPSVISGAQFLHEEIPDLGCGEAQGIFIEKIGTKEGYATKVYGHPDAPCSFDLLETGEHDAWPMLGIYTKLWEMYVDLVRDVRLYPADIKPLMRDYDLVISTVPRPLLCNYPGSHTFPGQAVFFDAKAEMASYDEGSFICYNGDSNHDWYRTSSIFGTDSTEYSTAMPGSWPSDKPLAQGMKPLSSNCNCHKGMLCVGRFGKWQKGVLVHHAYQEVVDALQQL
jgi:hypothetical protein